MKHTAKKIIAFVLLMFLMLPSPVPAFAHGGAGGVSQPTSPEAHSGDFPHIQGYGFRVFLYDTAGENYLWTGEDTYKSKSGMASTLDASASESAFYLGVGDNYKAYDAQYGETPWVGVDTMSASTFNTMPGMSGYTNPSSSYTDTNFDAYASIFNQIDEKAGTVEGMQEILDWYSAQGVNTSGYSAETTLVVVEPVVKWKYNGGYFTLTYQNIRKYDGTRDGCFDFFNFTPALNGNCIAEGDRMIPQAGTESGVTAFINGYLGAFHQSWIYDEGDCTTLPYDSSSGYAYYGCAKLIPDPDPTPTPEPTPPVIEEIEVDGDLKLQDYQLNYVYPKVVSPLDSYTELTKNEWTYDSGDNVYCGVCDSIVGQKNYSKNYNVTITDVSSGRTVDKDNSLSGTKALLYNTSAGAFTTRNVLLSGFSVDTSSSTTYVVEYGFNLIRSLFNDKRTVSTISNQELSQSFGQTVLELNYSNKPSGVVKVSPYRNSFATFGSISDTLAFNAKFNATGSLNGYQSYYDSSHSCHDDNDTEEITTDDSWGYETYHSLVQDKTLHAFTVNDSLSTTFSLDVNSIAYKYSTKANQIGKNTVSGLIDLVPCEENGMSRKLNKTYSFGVVKPSSTNLKIYPEVEMMAYEYSGDTISGLDSVTPKEVLTMGEELRTIQSSSLYLYTVKSHESSFADATGFTYSDTMETGADMYGADKIVATAGGDITFIGESNFSINLYGYSLDVINSIYDGSGFKISDTETIPYRDIIVDGSNIYSAWGNRGTTSLLVTTFNLWAKDMMDIDKYAVDLDLEVSNGYTKKEFNNFAATFGKFSSWDTYQDRAFPILIKNGSIVTSERGYQALIKSIAEDYDCSETKATELFNESGLCTAIYKAIESSSSDINQSQSGVDNLGNASHWYDEQVKTLVIRRYCSDPIYLEGITCSDKVDFGLAQDYNSNKSFCEASWFLTVYFTDEMNELGDFTVYNPANIGGTKNSAINTGNMLVNRLYINGADFLIGKGTTASDGW